MKWTLLLAIGLLLCAIVAALSFFEGQFALCIALAVLAVFALVFSLFEQKRVLAERLVLIALLASLACVGRVLFAAIPSVQPATFLIMLTGLVFGAEMGFLVGAVTALSSNLLLGQGPWTLWQMLLWGLVGACTALLGRVLSKNRPIFVLYGLLWGFLFGWGMNTLYLFGGFVGEISFAAYLTACLASAPMDLAHGLSNALLVAFFAKPFIKMLGRVARKYGLATHHTHALTENKEKTKICC